MASSLERSTTIYVYNSLSNARENMNGTLFTGTIVDGSMRYEHIFVDALPGFGDANSAMFSADLGGASNLTGKWIRVKYTYYETDESATTTDKWLFLGKVASCKYDKDKAVRTLVAYDQMYWIRQTDVSSYWKTYWNQQTQDVTLTTAIRAMCNNFNISYGQSVSFISLSLSKDIFKANSVNGCSVWQMLVFAAEISGKFLWFDGDGVLQGGYIGTGTPIDISDNIDGYETTIDDGDTEQFGSFIIYDGTDVVYSSGLLEPTFTISNNPFVWGQTTAALTIALQYVEIHLYDEVIQRPAEIYTIVSDPALTGNIRVASDANTNHYVSGIEMYGSQLINQILHCTGALNDSAGYEAGVMSVANNVQTLGVEMTFKVNADEVIEAVNLEAQNNVTINAQALNINGVVSANGTFKLDTAGNVTATGGKIGGWEIGTNYLRRVITIGQYDYQVLLYAPDNPISTTGAIAVQRRAAGTSDAWSSVTRMTYGGQLISSDADISGTVTTGNITATGGTIGGWTVVPTGLYRVITSGAYDYRVLLYTPDSPTDTSTAIAVQRRATGTSDAWASVTRITYGGKLISSDADITGTIAATSGSIAGWSIGSNSIEKSQIVSGTTYKAGLYAPTNITGNTAAIKVEGTNDLTINYDGTIHVGANDADDTAIIDGRGFETQSEYHDYSQGTDQDRRANAILNGSELSLSNSKRVGSANQRPSFEANLNATELLASLDLMAHTGVDSEAEASLEVADGEAYLYLDDGTDYSRLSPSGLIVQGVNYSTPTSGSGTRNTTNTTSGTLNYWRLGRLVVVAMTGTNPSVNTANAVLFSGLPEAIDSISFPAVPTTAQGAGRFYVDASGSIKIGGNVTAGRTYLANFTYICKI